MTAAEKAQMRLLSKRASQLRLLLKQEGAALREELDARIAAQPDDGPLWDLVRQIEEVS
jgi:hypothetical protein